jgi:hypothetical protein
LSHLEHLDFYECYDLSDLTPLAGLPKLRDAGVRCCLKVRDLSPLRPVLQRGGTIRIDDHDRHLWDQLDRLKAEQASKGESSKGRPRE